MYRCMEYLLMHRNNKYFRRTSAGCSIWSCTIYVLYAQHHCGASLDPPQDPRSLGWLHLLTYWIVLPFVMNVFGPTVISVGCVLVSACIWASSAEGGLYDSSFNILQYYAE